MISNLLYDRSTECYGVCDGCCDVVQAEEQLQLVEEQRKILEERQRLEDAERRRSRETQEIILNKKNARPKLSFALGKTS